jgi:hypothetical protein
VAPKITMTQESPALPKVEVRSGRWISGLFIEYLANKLFLQDRQKSGHFFSW